MVASAATCSDKLHWVYVLRDPRDNSIRYVGCSVKPKARKQIHIAYAKMLANSYNQTWSWIRELKQLGLEPVQQVVSDALEMNAAYEFEKDLISLFVRSGVKLCQSQHVPHSGRMHPRATARELGLHWVSIANKTVSDDVLESDEIQSLVFENVLPIIGKDKFYAGIWKSELNGQVVLGGFQKRFNWDDWAGFDSDEDVVEAAS
jgi:hypothetical protein